MFDIVFVIALLAGMIFLFLTEKLPVEITAFLALLALFAAGFLEPDEMFLGFSSPAVITVLSGFFIGAALQHTGVAESIGSRLRALAGTREWLLITLVMLVAALLSSVMPNVAAVAVMMPTTASLSRQTGVPASRMFMPLAFGAILGGTLTQIGTPPNLVAADVLRERGMEPFTLFSFTPFGVGLVAVGIVFMVVIGRHFLPARNTGGPPVGTELMRLYRISEKLFSLRIPAGSPLDGVALHEARMGTARGITVIAVRHDGATTLAPAPETIVREGDVLIVEGGENDLRELLRLRGIELSDAQRGVRIREWRGLFTGVLLRVGEGSPMVEHTIQTLRFRERYSGLVVALWRDGDRLFDRAGGVPLQEGDEILALGDRDEVEHMAVHPDFELVAIGPQTMQRLEESVFQVRVRDDSGLVGLSVRESRVGELMGLTVVGRIAADGELSAASPDMRFAAGDVLLVSGEPTRVADLLRFGDIRFGEEVEIPDIESSKVKIAEVIVAPRSWVRGRSLRELDFRNRFGLQALALMRGADPVHDGLADLTLRVGDVLLLQGPVQKMSLLGTDPGFMVLTPGYEEVFRTHRAPIALLALATMVGVVAAGLAPIQIAAFATAVAVVAFGAVTMEQAYQAIDWRTLFLVAAVLPIGTAIERSGTAVWLADGVIGVASGFGPYGLLVALMVLASLLSQVLTGAPTVALLGPIAFVAGRRAGVDVHPLLMGIALSSSIAFLTPISHRANLLVMGAGGYRPAEYAKVGGMLTLLALTLIAAMVPWLLPF